VADCNPFIADDFVFPRRPDNRPALVRCGYSIGSYPEFLEFLMRQINNSVELRAWTHRAPDDPGIALLQGAAILGDILTFYQERYANEAFLRTATWRESIAALTRLTGYRLAPGVGGRSTFAFEIKGTKPIEIPADHPLKADLEDLDKAAEFQTTGPLVAYPHFSRFHFYRHRYYGTTLGTSSPRLEIKNVGGVATGAAVDALQLKAGDRLMLLSTAPGWLSSGSSMSATQKTPQIVKVKSVTRQLGRTVVELEAPLVESWTLPVTAYRLGRAFRHFGHAAPPTYTQNTTTSSGKIDGAREVTTSYLRHIAGVECSIPSWTIDLTGYEIPLDQQVNDLVVASKVIVQSRITNGGTGTPSDVSVLRTITHARAATMGFGSQNGATTIARMNSPLSTNSTLWDLQGDVRDYQIHEVTSPGISLQPEVYFLSGGFSTGTNALNFFGRLSEVRLLADRRLLLQNAQGDVQERRCTNAATDFTLPAGAVDEPRMWQVSFDRAPSPLVRADFDENTPAVTVFGNIVDADQGKAEAEAVLGNGDARARFQTFRIPKAPLTYLVASGATPPQVPELEVFVNGRKWQRVESFFGRLADEEIYIVREDAEGTSYVQFGDGETGARLPSGIKNVVARYRTGTGAFGPVKAGTTPSSGRRIEGVDKVQLPGIVTGGAGPESGEKATETAPGRLQSLGRMVSLRDFETEVLTIPGVTSATASWGLQNGVATLLLRVLLEAGRESEFSTIRDTIQGYGRCRGADRFPIAIEQATLRYCFLDLLYAFDPSLVPADVDASVRAVLGLVGDSGAARTGLFGLRHRRLGEREYAQRIEGTVQNVPGILWCKASALGMFGASQLDPEAIPLPASPRTLATQLSPAPNQYLQLHPRHATLTTAPPPPAGECA
jgi:hypothetical protein